VGEMAEKLHAKLCGQSELVQQEPAIFHLYLRSPRFRLHREASGSTRRTSKAATGWGEKNTAGLPQPTRSFCLVTSREMRQWSEAKFPKMHASQTGVSVAT
jgi:hypothetical protein